MTFWPGNFSKQKNEFFMTGGVINLFFALLSKTVVKDRLEKERLEKEAREEAERKKEEESRKTNDEFIKSLLIVY